MFTVQKTKMLPAHPCYYTHNLPTIRHRRVTVLFWEGSFLIFGQKLISGWGESIVLWTELLKHFTKSERISFNFTEGLSYTFPDHKCRKYNCILQTYNRFLKWMQWKTFLLNVYVHRLILLRIHHSKEN